MYLMVRRTLALVLSVLLLLTVCAVPAYAESSYEGYAKKFGYIFNYLDQGDVANVLGVKNRIKNIAPATVAEAMGDDLITDALVQKFDGNRMDAKLAVATLMLQTVNASFCDSSENFESVLEAADSAISDVTDTIFGKDSAQAWLNMYLVARYDASDIQSAEDRYLWALGRNYEVYQSLDGLMIGSMDVEAQHYDLQDAFDELGWTAENVVAAMRNIMPLLDENNMGEWSLIKASARSAAWVVVDDGDFDINGGVDPESEDNVIRCDEFPTTMQLQLYIDLETGDHDVTDVIDIAASTVKGTGTATVEKKMVPGSERPSLAGVRSTEYGEVTFSDKGIYDVSVNRYSGASDWLVRFRVIVAEEIGNVEWNSLSGSQVTFNPVDKAETYTVNIYKDGKLIDTKEYSKGDALAVDFADYTGAYGSGVYEAGAIAYGSFPDEEYSEYEMISDEYSFTSTVGTVDKPAWKTDDNKDKTPVLTWSPAENATEYIVTVQGTGLDEPIVVRVPAQAGDMEYDFTEALQGKYGSFTATVQAVGKDGDKEIKGAVSEESDPYVVERKYALRGRVLLQGYNNSTRPRKDTNAGTIITVKGLGISTVSDAEGYYSFDNLPYTASGEYTLEYEKEGTYLKVSQKVPVDIGDAVPDQFLYFGNFLDYSGKKIYVEDISKLLSKYGLSEEDEGWDPSLSLGDDDYIQVIDAELSAVINNYGKTWPVKK